MAIQVVPIPCLVDNYAYLLFEEGGDGRSVVVDPGEAAPVISELARRGLTLTSILSTHHHHDHIGGNRELVERFSADVFGHVSEKSRILGMTHALLHEEKFETAGMNFQALHTPGHTMGALCYVGDGICFTGDTLFCAGCGRLFEGTPELMHHSLTSVLGRLNDETQIYCGHEYTENNLQFSLSLMPSQAIEKRLSEVQQKRKQGECCATASLATERETNLFLRCHTPALQAALLDSPVPPAERELAAFAELRKRKNNA